EIREQRHPADHVAPELVGARALAHGLAAQHHDAVDERAHAELLEEPRFADAALAPDEDAAALPGARLLEHVGERVDLRVAPHELRGLEEALARRGGLER